VKYAFIQEQSSYHAIQRLCTAIEVPRSGYYEWLEQQETPHDECDRLLKEWLVELFEASRATYGALRLRSALADYGIRVSLRRVSRLKREAGLVCKAQRRSDSTTRSAPDLPIAPNRLNRNFKSEQPDTVYVGDITSIPTAEGWLYLAVWIDLYSRSVVGWSMAEPMRASLVTDALTMAL